MLHEQLWTPIIIALAPPLDWATTIDCPLHPPRNILRLITLPFVLCSDVYHSIDSWERSTIGIWIDLLFAVVFTIGLFVHLLKSSASRCARHCTLHCQCAAVVVLTIVVLIVIALHQYLFHRSIDVVALVGPSTPLLSLDPSC